MGGQDLALEYEGEQLTGGSLLKTRVELPTSPSGCQHGMRQPLFSRCTLAHRDKVEPNLLSKMLFCPEYTRACKHPIVSTHSHSLASIPLYIPSTRTQGHKACHPHAGHRAIIRTSLNLLPLTVSHREEAWQFY